MAPQNGNVPSDLLVVRDGMLLARDTAAAYDRANAASGGQLSLAKPAGAYRSLAVQADMIANPGRYNLNPASSVALASPGHSSHGTGNRLDLATGNSWMLSHGGQFGFTREFGAADPNHWEFAAETWPGAPAPVVVPTVPAVKGWQVGETDFTGKYGENELNGARWYCIEPDTSADKTIWSVAQAHGLTLDQVKGWTSSVASSRWGGQLLQSGSSWWDGSNRYFAGVCIALNDVAAILDAYDAQQTAAQQSAAQAAQEAATAAVAANKAQVAEAEEVVKIATDTDAEATASTAQAKASTKANVSTANPRVIVSDADAKTDAAKLQPEIDSLPTSDAGNSSAPLAGLLAGRTLTRKRAYYVYASASLLVSFAPDVIVAGVLTGHEADVTTAVAGLAASLLLKIGVAFGFVAASNTGA